MYAVTRLPRIAAVGAVGLPRKAAFMSKRQFPLLSALAAAVLLAACATQPEQLMAAQEPADSVYAGWRMFQDRCASCHGDSAAGAAAGVPDLLPRVRGLGPREFVDLLLTRYEWAIPPAQPVPSTAEREAFIDDVVQRRKGEIPVPERQGEPRVQAHVMDLHAYLSARADGTVGAGRPPR
jgi:mono/diheme cytochrome c family protein